MELKLILNSDWLQRKVHSFFMVCDNNSIYLSLPLPSATNILYKISSEVSSREHRPLVRKNTLRYSVYVNKFARLIRLLITHEDFPDIVHEA